MPRNVEGNISGENYLPTVLKKFFMKCECLHERVDVYRRLLPHFHTAVVANVGIAQRFTGSATLMNLPTNCNQLQVTLVTQVFNEICIIHGQFCGKSRLFGLSWLSEIQK